MQPSKKRKFLLIVFLISFELLANVSSGITATIVAPVKSKSAKAASPSDGSELAYMIGPENMVQIKIFGEADLSQIYRVDELGYINHALVGRVQLAGSTVSAAEKIMESKLAGDYILNPKVTIFVLEHSHFSILGEVRKPGTYEILGRVSIIEAMSMAGGFTPVADQRHVKIIRKGVDKDQTLNIDAAALMQGGNRDNKETTIQANDVINVPKSFF